ncbi:ribosylnicotinamide kinase [Coelomomyces lativittatus]|nr:ribosylnicotinamide kinase [Coelomomyces lativittatus]
MNAFQNTITYILQARSVKELEKLWLEKELHLDGQIHVPDTNDTSLPDWICTDTLRPMLHSLLSKLASSKAVVVLLDGFLLHYEPSVCMNMHGNIFLSCSYETCQYRRSLRSGYLSNDGQVWSDPPNYFENLVWPSYLCLNDRILSNSTICQSMESCFKHFPSERINLDGQEILILDSNDFGMEGIISNLQIALSFISERIMMANYDDGDRVI